MSVTTFYFDVSVSGPTDPGGGAGGFAGSGSANRTGGNGGAGTIIVHEYY